ncbi:MAG: BatD family protein [candidate division KSB1 bacterium]|nr:BatD family protein [candidate division KSB1 bacterium]
MRGRFGIGKWVLAALAALGASVSFGQGSLSVSARVVPNPVGLNQTFRLEIELEGPEAQGAVDVSLPDLSEFATYLGSQGTSQSIQIIGGRMSVSRSFNYAYMATKSGKFTIPPIEVRVGGKSVRTDAVSIEVLAAPPSAPAQPSPGRPASPAQPQGEDQIFLRAKVNKQRVYVGEPVIVTFSIYTRLNVTGYAITKLPSTTGFWVEDIDVPQPAPTYEENIDGVRYAVADIKKMALFPTTPGELKIEPMAVDCEVRVRRTSRPRDFFDAFFEDPFFGSVVRQTLYSSPVTIRVLPLPDEGRPADFSGAVGQFRMDARLDKDSVLTNEAVSLTVRIHGTGNIRVIGEPKLELPPDIERYDPKVTEQIDRSGNSVGGSKTFEYVLVPRFAGEQVIRPIRFSYFDPAAGQYKTLMSPSFVIRVGRGKEEAALVPGMSKTEVRLVGQDIRFIRTEVSGWHRIGWHVHRTALFYLGLIMPAMALGAAVAYRRQQDRLAGDLALARARRAQRGAAKRLRRARSLLRVERQEEFYAEVSRAIVGFVADKLNVPAAGVTSEAAESLLRQRGVPESVLAEFLDLWRICDFQRFAPAASDTSEMQKVLERAESVIVQLEKAL